MIKNIIKKALKLVLSYRLRRWLRECNKKHKILNLSFYDCLFRIKLYVDKRPGSPLSAKLFDKMLRKAKVLAKDNYLYPFDPFRKRIPPQGIVPLASITPDYGLIIKSDLNEIKQRLERSTQSEFRETMLLTINSIEQKAEYISRVEYSNARYRRMASLFPDILHRDCESLDEALQKILFYNALFWQSGHFHNGLGRLDLILYPYYLKDVNGKIIDRAEAKQMLKDFCHLLGSQTPFKSQLLIGDTGQYILLGGIDKSGNTVDNELTHIFLEIFTEMRKPDPKLILRVNSETPTHTWHEALKCVMNGCGSPLFMNETLIMDNMVKFGYAKKDVWNVGTSACWEPLIIGKSSDQNNPFASMLACKPLNDAICSGKNFQSFEDLLAEVKRGLEKEAHSKISDKEYDYSPLYSLFMDECLQRGKDFSHKGSKYMYQGAQLLGFPNLVNSLLNIKMYVYDNQLVSLADCRDIIVRNYEGHEDLRQLFSGNKELKFGIASPEVIDLCNELIYELSKAIKDITANGNPVKFGLSSPNYIKQARSFPATLDGRKAHEPFAVHISPTSSSIDISEVMHFACKLDYPFNCLNGNVVDFILPTAYQKQSTKFASMLMDAFNQGVFQLQLNVLDKQTLIDAKLHPEKYPTLVVWVWGFSAYFNDLPEEYKDNLIARAETYEVA